jgi:hypothetical protein
MWFGKCIYSILTYQSVFQRGFLEHMSEKITESASLLSTDGFLLFCYLIYFVLLFRYLTPALIILPERRAFCKPDVLEVSVRKKIT